jgi:hypothetical protein
MSTTTLPQRRANAVARADTLTVDYFICPDQQTVIIASATTVGRLYTVTATECSCGAARTALQARRIPAANPLPTQALPNDRR